MRRKGQGRAGEKKRINGVKKAPMCDEEGQLALSRDNYNDDDDDDEDDEDEDDDGDDHHRLTGRDSSCGRASDVCMYRRLPVGSFGLT